MRMVKLMKMMKSKTISTIIMLVKLRTLAEVITVTWDRKQFISRKMIGHKEFATKYLILQGLKLAHGVVQVPVATVQDETGNKREQKTLHILELSAPRAEYQLDVRSGGWIM
jgi:hypothetical protein